MAKTSGTRPRGVIFGLACALGAVAGGCAASKSKLQGPEPPLPDLSLLEPPVAAKIEQARRDVLREPDSAERWGRLGIIFEVHELLPEAVECYARTTELDPMDFRWPYFAGCCLFSSDQQRSVVEFQKAVRLKPDHAPLHIRLADALLRTDQIDEAGAHYARAVELDSSLAHAPYGLARVARLNDRTEDAIGHLEAAAKLSPPIRGVHSMLAQVYRQLGNDAAVDQAVARAASIKTDKVVPDRVRDVLPAEGVSTEWHARRAASHRAAGRHEAAVLELRKALDIYPESSLFLFKLGAALARLGRFDGAAKHYEHSLRIQPDYYDAHYGYAVTMANLRQLSKAAHHFRRAYEINPASADARYNLGSTLIQLGRSQEGLVHLRAAAEVMTENTSAFMYLAGALTRAGQMEEAILWYRRVLAIQPDDIDATVQLGAAQARTGRTDDAIQSFQEAIRVNPTHAEAHHSLAIALATAERFKEAVDAFQRGLTVAPAHPGMSAKLAWLLAACPIDQCRNGAEAVRIADRLCQSTQGTNPHQLDTLAAAYAEVGRFDDAIATARKALSILEQTPGFTGLAQRIRLRIKTYQGHQPYRGSQ